MPATLLKLDRTARAGAAHLPALDGLRGLAVLVVMFFHFIYLGSIETNSKLVKLAVMSTSWGWMGVDLFFVLSGFLITGILLRQKETPGYFRNFYARRILRIFPLYYTALVILFFVAPHLLPLDADSRKVYDLQGWLWSYAGNLETALHGAFNYDGGWYRLSHLWSLAVEEHFYLVWPLVVWALAARSLLKTAATACLAAPLLRTAMVLAHVFPGTIYVFTIFRADALAMGAILAVYNRRPEGLAALVPYTRWLFPAAAVFVGISLLSRVGNWHWTMSTFGYSIVDLGCASLLVSALTSASRWPEMLESRFLRTFGKYSYGIYLLHWPLQGTFRRYFFAPFLPSGHEAVGMVFYLLASIAVSLLAAMLIWHLYERQFLRLKRFFEYRAVG